MALDFDPWPGVAGHATTSVQAEAYGGDGGRGTPIHRQEDEHPLLRSIDPPVLRRNRRPVFLLCLSWYPFFGWFYKKQNKEPDTFLGGSPKKEHANFGA